MERLTQKQSAGYDLKAVNGEWCDSYCQNQRIETCNECGIYQAIQKLAYYEDAEEEGRLIVLPCKVGSKVYKIVPDLSVCWPDPPEYKVIQSTFNLNDIYEFGEETFLTLEEAKVTLTIKNNNF